MLKTGAEDAGQGPLVAKTDGKGASLKRAPFAFAFR